MSDITHIVKSYEDELQSLNDNLIKMGSLVETQLSDSMEAIIKVDKEAAENIIKNDEKINELRATIEEQIVMVLVKRAPMAIDLRLTISTLKISSDLERIGDFGCYFQSSWGDVGCTEIRSCRWGSCEPW